MTRPDEDAFPFLQLGQGALWSGPKYSLVLHNKHNKRDETYG